MKRRKSRAAPRCEHGAMERYCLKCKYRKPGKFRPLSDDQKKAVDEIMGGNGPFFLTGTAGSGKTYVVEHLQDLVPETIVCAMTGIAAQLIGGKTAHSVLGIHPKFGVNEHSKANYRLRECELLIIDEISMASSEFFEQIYQRFEWAMAIPKVVFVGDFLQLPPVSGNKIFKSPDWLASVKLLKLDQQHRQHDNDFITALNEIRIGGLSDKSKELFSKRIVNSLPNDCVHLLARRDAVEDGNLARLKELPSIMRTYIREETRTAAKGDDPKDEDQIADSIWKALKDVRFPQTLQLKDGARVVLLTNTDEWVNGSTGEVVDMTDSEVRVRLDANGKVVTVGWTVEEISDADGLPLVTVRQIPILLAWSMTIHKAQGMTLDRVGIDLRGHFEFGQTYVALSRCRYLDGLFLVGDFGQILVDREAKEYLKEGADGEGGIE